VSRDIGESHIPYIERTVGGSPSRRALLGHSHGGTFVDDSVFAESPGSHTGIIPEAFTEALGFAFDQ
jgi:predicted alpha/beta superfamily hydrolase